MPAANVSSADLAIEECTIVGTPRRGLNPTNATNPRLCGIIQRLATSWVRFQLASTFSRCTARIPFSGICSSGAGNCPPALLTRTSIRPICSPRPSSIASTCSSSRTSHGKARQAGPSSSRTNARSSARRPQIATRAPVWTSSRAVARPIPVPPPVTNARRPAFASLASGERNRSSATDPVWDPVPDQRSLRYAAPVSRNVAWVPR